MVKYKIEFDRELCIGAIACTAVAESFWPRSDDGKVDLSGATYNEETKKWELIIEEKDYEINKEAAEVCPVDAIYTDDDVPSDQSEYTEIDALWFKDPDAARKRVDELVPIE